MTPEEEVQLAVLFGDGQGGTAFADYVVSYASQLVAQIADVANIAVGDNDFAKLHRGDIYREHYSLREHRHYN